MTNTGRKGQRARGGRDAKKGEEVALKCGDVPHLLVVQMSKSVAHDVLPVLRACLSAQPGGHGMFGKNPQRVVHRGGIGRNKRGLRRDGRKRECRRRGSKETEKSSAFHAQSVTCRNR